MELVIFVLGAIFSFALQFLVARLGLLREKARESWIRRLNSYQDFHTATLGLAELWQADAEVPESHVWEAIARARKAAYDAALYDSSRTHLTGRMRELSLELVRVSSQSTRVDADLQRMTEEARAIWGEFATSERALRQPTRLRWLRS